MDYSRKEISLADLPLREDLQGKTPYGAPQLHVEHALNTNENPYSPSENLQQAIARTALEVSRDFNRYPDRDAIQLRETLADYINRTVPVDFSFTRDNIWVANGSNEILLQILQAFAGPGTYALGANVSYSMHPIITETTFTSYESVPVTDDLMINLPLFLDRMEQKKPRVVFITRPNNPTGHSESIETVRTIIEHAPYLVVVDEAYAEFSSSPSALELYEEFSHKMIVTRTMSKAFAFAGGRLGYFIAAPAVVEAILLVRLPYHLSSLSQQVAITALTHADETLSTVHKVINERNRVAYQLQEMGYVVHPSDANFLLYGNYTNPAQAWQRYLDEKILVRDLRIQGKLRVSMGLPESNDAFLAVSRELAATGSVA